VPAFVPLTGCSLASVLWRVLSLTVEVFCRAVKTVIFVLLMLYMEQWSAPSVIAVSAA
jgi:hypothetical protein